MNNVTKALAYLLVMSLLLTAGGFYYHKTATPTPTPTPADTTPTDTTPTDTTPADGNEAVGNDFVNRAQTIFNAALSTWSADTQTAKAEKRYCNVEGCAAGLNESFDPYHYNIVVSETGNIVKFYVTNDEFQFGYAGEGLFIDNISSTKISDIDPSQVINITAEM